MKKVILFLLGTSLFVASCNSDKKDETTDKKDTMAADSKDAMGSSSSKAEKNRQTALASAMAINAHDVDAILKDAASDAVDYGDGSMPPVKNMDSVKAGVKAWLNAFPDIKVENPMALSDADGSHVVVLGVWTGTFKNDLMGMKATGKTFKYWDGDLFTFNSDGKITEHRGIQSSITLMSQIGAKMGK